jgi:hypothetical protein
MKKSLAILFALITSVSLSGCALLYPNWDTTQSPGTSQSAEPSNSEQPSESASPTTPSKAIAKVQIDDASADATAGVINALAEITNFSEDGGTCTLVVKAGTTTKKVSFKAESNVSTTQCYPMQLPLAGLPKGTALVSVQYESAKYFGESAGISVVIP